MSIIMDGSDPLVFKGIFKNGIRELTWPKTMMLKTAHIDSDVFELVDNKIQAEQEWIGEGLPPVGFEGFAKSNRTQTIRACIVLAIRQGMAVVCFPDHEELQWASEFKTKSQFEAERARSAVCDRIYGIITGSGVERKGNTSDMAEALYDAGLRFIEVTK